MAICQLHIAVQEWYSPLSCSILSSLLCKVSLTIMNIVRPYSTVSILPCEPRIMDSNQTYCCANYKNSGSCCANNFTMDPGTPFAPISMAAMSSSTLESNSTAGNMPSQPSLVTIGVAIGAPLVVLLLGLSIFFIYRERKWKHWVADMLAEKEGWLHSRRTSYLVANYPDDTQKILPSPQQGVPPPYLRGPDPATTVGVQETTIHEVM